MQYMAQTVFSIDPDYAATIGWIHDVGYFYGDNKTHAKLGGQTLRQMGLRCHTSIKEHGSTRNLDSPVNYLLNLADMSVASDGTVGTLRNRLDDIESRYGLVSEQYVDARNVCNELRMLSENQKIMIRGCSSLLVGFDFIEANGVSILEDPEFLAIFDDEDVP